MAKESKDTRTGPGARKMPRMLERYQQDIVPALSRRFGHRNALSAPRLKKIVINMGCGEAAHDAKVLEQAQRDLTLISGQRPKVTRAKRAVSNFRIREKDAVGCMVTLRRDRMYEFLDRLVSTALPRIRDFRGLNPRGFDQGGNYCFGLREQTIFPEIALEQVQHTLGMDIVVVTSAATRDEAHALLKGFGFPFAESKTVSEG